jgi:hypothetical protein
LQRQRDLWRRGLCRDIYAANLMTKQTPSGTGHNANPPADRQAPVRHPRSLDVVPSAKRIRPRRYHYIMT